MVEAPLSEPRRSDWISIHRRKILLILTLIAGVMRCAFLERPPIWLDEAMTFSRVCGSFHQMLEILRLDGFPPLHYELYWLLGKCTFLSPTAMRIIPALLGTLMVPAIYFLAVQMVGVRTALLAAAFTASSAYLIVYSHDAKMYMGAWCLLTLHLGFLLWWPRQSGRRARVGWLAWVAAGLGMGGMHFTTLVILAIEPVILFMAYRVRRWKILFFVIGVAIIVAGPMWYFLGFSHWRQEVQRLGFAQGSGLAWVNLVNSSRGGPDLILHTATAYLLSWEWPTLREQPMIQADALHALMIASVAVLLVLGLAALPWRNGSDDPGVQPRWKVRLWLAIWIVPIAYGWYCGSTPHFVSPLAWVEPVGQLFSGRWFWLVAEIAAMFAIIQIWPGVAKFVAAAIGISAALCLVGCLVADGANYWSIARAWWGVVSARECLIALCGAVPVLAWHFSGESFTQRLRRSGMFLGTVVVIVALCGAVYFVYMYRVHRLTAQMMVKRHPADWSTARQMVWNDWSSVWVPRYLGIIWPAVAISVCMLLMRLPTRPLRYAAIAALLGMNIAMGAVRIFADSETPMDRIVHDVDQSQGSQPTRTILCHLSTFMLDNPVTPSAVGMQGRYYMSQIGGRHLTPEEFRETPPFPDEIQKVWHIKLALDIDPKAAAKRLRELPDVRRLIVWDVQYAKGEKPDRFAAALGTTWKKISEQTFAVRMHWTWANTCVLSRREYRRIDVPATQKRGP